jgi:hypothetical protein
MKTKQYVKPWTTRILATALAVGLAGAMDSVQAQKTDSNGTNDAEEQKTMIRRDPFWPVGYVPKKVTSIVPVEISTKSEVKVDNSWNEAMKKVVINGVSSRAENAYIAVINNQIKSIGDTVTVNHSGTLYTWAVDVIEPPDSVKLRRVSAM